MDYKEKYEKLARLIKDLYPFMSDYCKEKIEGMIPELKESEDEKIRKDIIKYLRSRYEDPNAVDCKYDKWIAWLEKQGKQKPAWSEEDEKMVESCLLFVNANRTHPLATKCIDWLRTLKPQSRWKPSDEQMEALSIAIRAVYAESDIQQLESLYNDLKKL